MQISKAQAELSILDASIKALSDCQPSSEQQLTINQFTEALAAYARQAIVNNARWKDGSIAQLCRGPEVTLPAPKAAQLSQCGANDAALQQLSQSTDSINLARGSIAQYLNCDPSQRQMDVVGPLNSDVVSKIQTLLENASSYTAWPVADVNKMVASGC
ncbi:MAG: hypothetical protein AAGA91_13025 [Pseudomonadota bacterium]